MASTSPPSDEDIGLLSRGAAVAPNAGMPITSFRDLDAWKMSMNFAESVYRVTRLFPEEERYGLRGQARRSAVCIPSNVAEGHQQGAKAFAHYLTISIGSLNECETQLELARRLEMAPDASLSDLLERAKPVGRVLHGLLRSVRQGAGHSRVARPGGDEIRRRDPDL